MAQYKCVAGPGSLNVKKMSQLQDAVATYGDIITRETVGGWELHGIYPIQISKKQGIFSTLVLGLNEENYEYNMLVFKKE